jgi:hypothetical protein
MEMANIVALIEAQTTLFQLKKVTDQILQSILFNFDIKPASEIVCAVAREEDDEEEEEEDVERISVLKGKNGKMAGKKAENIEKKVWKNKYLAKEEKKQATQSAICRIVQQEQAVQNDDLLLSNDQKQKPTKQERKRKDKKRQTDRATKTAKMHF